ncbi:MAG TPA: phytanoyl-CoA dioxygenase family protein [Chitinophagales bacterium]|nr:phytanoyl-CoA dioxygenase family protein [Chitinophagales bacterium]HLP52747.1 phytanoyl-CoA dioxygenase family protein [Chitinophagales bacterium]
MRNVLKDKAAEEQFQKDGYISMPLLSAEEVKTLYDFYVANNVREDYYQNNTAEFSILHAERQKREEIFNLITGILLPKLENIVNGYKPLIANFICKDPGKGQVPVHQNWAVVDEKKFTSISIWCPLVDVTETNGTLQFVPGSHKRFRGIRGSRGNVTFNHIEKFVVDNYLVKVPLKAGNCIILDDSVIHYSDINQSDKIRLSIQLIMYPQEATPLHHTFVEENGATICETYEADASYYWTIYKMKGALEKYKLVSRKKFQSPVYNEEQFAAKMRGEAEEKTGLIDRLKAMFA